MADRHLFLHGGSPPFLQESGRTFSKLVPRSGKTAVLFLEREGWQEYMKRYTQVLEAGGLHDFTYIALHRSPEEIADLLSECKGVIIGGGDTEQYHTYIVGTPVGTCIRELYQKGVPIAGFSAGALISPAHCVIPPIDNDRKLHLFLDGLGLLSDCVISVHFSKWNEEENLINAVHNTHANIGYGIDDEACAYFENEKLVSTEGNLFIYQPAHRE
ncbi:Type 1 glutamine amidotransferase-like domain-containing protein [Peribacillus deserti]|uniref:Peptidase S51 dipeptidase E n=1 Tax=Peribacillus deserti TaxID=673318 RepID=A0A2N5M4P1_9BACI|nr:Type 1 glutamine amidotransferase-like domain-containing protein [Peribacillus deserti]PLT29329.1 peptidase S51 dipeptidase E [Peribacillus deserti]